MYERIGCEYDKPMIVTSDCFVATQLAQTEGALPVAMAITVDEASRDSHGSATMNEVAGLALDNFMRRQRLSPREERGTPGVDKTASHQGRRYHRRCCRTAVRAVATGTTMMAVGPFPRTVQVPRGTAVGHCGSVLAAAGLAADTAA